METVRKLILVLQNAASGALQQAAILAGMCCPHVYKLAIITVGLFATILLLQHFVFKTFSKLMLFFKLLFSSICLSGCEVSMREAVCQVQIFAIV